MRTITRFAGAAVALAATSLATIPASASSIIMTSAVYGNDGTCVAGDPTKPCRTFFKSLSLASSGDVIYLDAGSYFNSNIDKSITIFSRHGATFFGGESPCLRINAGPADVINIDGIICIAANDGNQGIEFNTGEKLRVRNSIIRNGTADSCGISFSPNTDAELFIENTIISEHGVTVGGGGVCIVPRAGAAITGTIDRLHSENNRYGLRTSNSGTPKVSMLIQNSVFSNNFIGIRSTGASAGLRISNTAITGNGTGLQSTGGGGLISLGDNVVRANTTDGVFTATEAKQ